MAKGITVEGKLVSGINIVGYLLKNSKTGKTSGVKLEDVITLASKGRIDKAGVCEIPCEDGTIEKVLYIETPLEEIQTVEFRHGHSMEVIYRIERSDSNSVDYMCKDADGKNHRLRFSKVWELAYLGNIKNCKAIVCGGKKALLGVDTDISKLPSITD